MSRQSLKSVCKLLESASTEVKVEDAFLRDLKRSMELYDAKNRRQPSLTYKPSSMQCIRNMYYQRIGAAQDAETSSSVLIGICESGTDRHIRVQDAISHMKDNGIDCEYVDVAKFVRQRNLQNIAVMEHSGNEVKLYNTDYDISFMCDGIIKYQGRYYIIEIKTESAYKWAVRKGVDPKHYEQAVAYSMSLGLSEVLFIYVNRDNSDMKSYLFPVPDNMRYDLMQKITTCEEFVKEQKVPDKPEDILRTVCEYCDYKKQCRKDG